MLEYAKACTVRAIDQKLDIIVGDASGVDEAVRNTCYEHRYLLKLTIYKPTNRPIRIPRHFHVHMINLGSGYLDRTFKMTELADIGMHIWNGSSGGTKASFDHMCMLGKTCWLWQDGKIVSQQIKETP